MGKISFASPSSTNTWLLSNFLTCGSKTYLVDYCTIAPRLVTWLKIFPSIRCSWTCPPLWVHWSNLPNSTWSFCFLSQKILPAPRSCQHTVTERMFLHPRGQNLSRKRGLGHWILTILCKHEKEEGQGQVHHWPIIGRQNLVALWALRRTSLLAVTSWRAWSGWSSGPESNPSQWWGGPWACPGMHRAGPKFLTLTYVTDEWLRLLPDPTSSPLQTCAGGLQSPMRLYK